MGLLSNMRKVGEMLLKDDITKIIMNPVRMRVIQYLLTHARGTAKEIGDELSDVPKASLYRHIKILVDNGLLIIIEETKVRGAVEKTYALNQEQPMGDYSEETVRQIIQNSLFMIMAEFDQYFAKEQKDPKKDMLSLTSCTLMLSEQEFQEMMMKIGAIYQEVIQNGPSEGRKARRITLISSPCEEE